MKLILFTALSRAFLNEMYFLLPCECIEVKMQTAMMVQFGATVLFQAKVLVAYFPLFLHY